MGSGLSSTTQETTKETTKESGDKLIDYNKEDSMITTFQKIKKGILDKISKLTLIKT